MAQVHFKESPVSLQGNFPSVGEMAKDFTLVDKDLKDCSLKDYAGKKRVLSIVPSLDTSVCSSMAKEFNKSIQAYPDAALLLISADLPFAQKRFCDQEHTDQIITLSMMRDKAFAEDYGVLVADGPLKGLCARAVIVIDEEGKILYTQLVNEITDEPDYDLALESLV